LMTDRERTGKTVQEKADVWFVKSKSTDTKAFTSRTEL
jgi:hypothetical protein